MAQLGARLDGIEEVEGSNPFGSTSFERPGFRRAVCKRIPVDLRRSSGPIRPASIVFHIYILQSESTSARLPQGQNS